MTQQDQLASFFSANPKIAHVRLTRVRGSAPRDAGADMFVASKSVFGTIGGGRLEQMVIEQARALLRRGDISDFIDVPLGPEIGQCCGGRVEAQLTRMSQRDRDAALKARQRAQSALPCVYILGAGHVGRALADFFALLPVQAIVVDSRADQLDMCTAPVDRRHRAIPEVDILNAPAGSAFIVVTHDHALDFLLASAALERGDAAYVGLIGSRTKRAKFVSWCRTQCSTLSMEGLTCPIGGKTSSDKRPAVIASFVAAEVMAELTANQPAQPVKSHDAIVAFNKAEHPGNKSSRAGL